MDRRRYVPKPEGLEGRALMSLFGGRTASANRAISVANLPENFQVKETRIAHLSYYLEQTQPGRFLNADTMKQLQAELLAISGTLHNPPTAAQTTFNNALRHVYPYQTLSPANAAYLNKAFTSFLVHSGASTQNAQALQSTMSSIAYVDAKSMNSSFLAANDYSLVLQTALAVGRVTKTPSFPQLVANNGSKLKSITAAATRQTTPTMSGIYDAGRSANAFTTMQIVDTNGAVVGSGVVDNSGRYAARITVPLSVGIHELRARAVDVQGHYSNESQGYFRLKILPPRGGSSATATTSFVATNPGIVTSTISTATVPTSSSTRISSTPTSPAGGPLALL